MGFYNYVSKNFYDQTIKLDDWEKNGIPGYIVVIDLDSTQSDYIEKDYYYLYECYNIGVDVYQDSWLEYRLDYLINNNIIEKNGYFDDLGNLQNCKSEE